jgi:hypothetical protein
VAASLGALSHDNVTTGVERPPGVVDFAAHRDHQDLVIVTEIHHVRGNAEARDEGAGASLDEELNVGHERVGEGGEQIDDVRARVAAISWASWALDIVEAPRQPYPPAFETAAASALYETPPMPASMTGCSMPRRSVSRVFMKIQTTHGGALVAATRSFFSCAPPVEIGGGT